MLTGPEVSSIPARPGPTPGSGVGPPLEAESAERSGVDPGRSGPLEVGPAVDAALVALAPSAPARLRWLTLQTVLGGPSRRASLETLRPYLGAEVVDLGCGLGAFGVEIAAVPSVRSVVGVDGDPGALEVARRLRSRLGRSRLGRSDPVTFLRADATDLPFRSGAADSVVARLLFQHLRPAVRRAAIAEAHRVLRPGGHFVVLDVDDQLELSWPPPSPAYARLAGALAALQAAGGGDRTIGRKVPVELAEAGFEVVETRLLLDAAYGTRPELGRALLLERFRRAAGEIVAAGIASADRVRLDIEALAVEEATPRFETSGLVVVVAGRPEDDRRPEDGRGGHHPDRAGRPPSALGVTAEG